MPLRINRVFSIHHSSFGRYGWVIELPGRRASRKRNLFRIIVRQKNTGWRIAYLVVREKVIEKLEQHPDSLESFEPLRGRALLFVARKRDIRDIRCFCLDQPVILKKGVWHGVVTLGREADIKITENDRVKCVYWKTGLEMGIRVK